MANIGKGAKIKFTLHVDGLGEASLKDEGVDFKVDFYAMERSGQAVNNFVTVDKEHATADEEDDNTYYLVVDTSSLDYGTLCGTLEVDYTDDATGETLVEKLQIVSDVKIVSIPEAPEPTEPEEPEVPEEEQQ